MAADDAFAVELATVIREIQERVRERYPLSAAAGRIALPDLLPILHARDRAEAKIAAIGTVNPRPPGLINAGIQSGKRLLARVLGFLVREQVDFNRAAMDCVHALLEALHENNRALQALAADSQRQVDALRAELLQYAQAQSQREAAVEALLAEARELKDIRTHWAEWRKEWERKLAVNEVQFLRSVADLQSAFQHQAALRESNFRETVAGQHRDFEAALSRSRIEIQERLWRDLETIRREYEALIHRELRVLRQRALAGGGEPPRPPAPGPPPPPQSVAPFIDWLRFAERFRGSEEWVRAAQQRHLAAFSGCRRVLDLGCGRGEFLALLQQQGTEHAFGVDGNQEMVALCRQKGLHAEQADLFVYLDSADPVSWDGIYCGQVVEHLPPERLPELARLCARVLRPGGVLLIETPNPACLAVFATHFYLDPTHQRPVPAPLLAFYLEEAGFGRIRVETLHPAVEQIHELSALPDRLRERLFGGMDYALTAVRL